VRGHFEATGGCKGYFVMVGGEGVYSQIRHFTRVKGYFEAIRAFSEGEGVF